MSLSASVTIHQTMADSCIREVSSWAVCTARAVTVDRTLHPASRPCPWQHKVLCAKPCCPGYHVPYGRHPAHLQRFVVRPQSLRASFHLKVQQEGRRLRLHTANRDMAGSPLHPVSECGSAVPGRQGPRMPAVPVQLARFRSSTQGVPQLQSGTTHAACYWQLR